ncbi:MAG: Peptidoglycan glycosyltransferase [Bacteroidota bacterium]|jgi:cell division protein FtsI (penicillin-binding protein 3)|nr:Peptidoglycan glycosyltransferase [Bacteroidota bacterium]
MENKKDILSRTYLVYIFLCVFAIAILYKMCIIQFKEGSEWKAKAEAFNTQVHEIQAVRGNIFDINGNLLATSLPYYEVAVDINAPSIDKKLFESKVDSLGTMLSELFKDKTPKQYIKLLRKARKSGDRYVVLKRNVPYKDLQTLKTFPIFKKGKRGGLVTLQTNKRERPFKMLAARTIGMARAGVKPVGLEGAYDTVLMGISGQRLMQKIAGDVWRPINDENEVEPKDGSDLFTTIDINIQDVAENALLNTLIKNKASHGCAILMEVKTGEIKAIANLTRDGKDSSSYSESLNYAIGYATEPGSTFKLASYLAVMDDYDVNLDEKIRVGNGEVTYYNKTIRDAHPPETPMLTLKRAFEVSSNAAAALTIVKYYSKNPQQYINKLKSFHLNQKLGLAIPGEANPLIKEPKSKDWSGLTLPQMAYGYESLITPLQTLALYNAIANDGKMVKPRFEKEIKHNGKTVKTFTTEVLVEQIVKPETVKKAKEMLEGVVENGSGKGLNITAFKVGGKTGTAQIAKVGVKRGAGKTAYGDVGERNYQASFVGYFPADKPLYTCIVIINSPSNGIYYGGLVAGPVFKEIAEKVYSNSLDFIEPLNTKKQILTKVPACVKSRNDEIVTASKAFKIKVKSQVAENNYVVKNNDDTLSISLRSANLENQLKKGVVPNLNGLSAKDALFLLENSGFHVKLYGMGSVKKQSIEAGKKFNKGDKITLILS